MGARNESEALGYYLTRPRRRWASAAARETAQVLPYRRRFVGAHGGPCDQPSRACCLL